MIEIAKCQKNSPNTIQFDSRNNHIELNKKIAYNFSGSVSIGYIKSIEKNEWKKTRKGINDTFWWHIKFEMKVENENGNISTIKNPNSFIIL